MRSSSALPLSATPECQLKQACSQMLQQTWSKGCRVVMTVQDSSPAKFTCSCGRVRAKAHLKARHRIACAALPGWHNCSLLDTPVPDGLQATCTRCGQSSLSGVSNAGVVFEQEASHAQCVSPAAGVRQGLCTHHSGCSIQRHLQPAHLHHDELRVVPASQRCTFRRSFGACNCADVTMSCSDLPGVGLMPSP